MWLNNCIGDLNYGYFRKVSIAFWFLCFISLAFVIAMIPTKLLFEFGDKIHISLQIIMWFQGFMSLLCLILDTHLIGFHTWIISLNITTYEYIGYEKNLETKKAQLKSGEISNEEFKIWKYAALHNPERQKSRVIKKRDFGNPNRILDESKFAALDHEKSASAIRIDDI